MNDPVLAAVLRAAVSATSATAGWMLAVRENELEVVAVAGAVQSTVVGLRVPGSAGTAGFVVGSSQPLALAAGRDDPRLSEGVAAAIGRSPAAVLCVPCDDGGVIAGAVELVDKAGGASFTFDDVELATLLAGIAAVALTEGAGAQPPVPRPDQLGAELRALAAADPRRYAAMAAVVAGLLAGD